MLLAQLPRRSSPAQPLLRASSPTYYPCAYEYRPDCTCKGCVAARPTASNSPRYAPSSPDVHDCDNADCPCVGCAAVRAAHSPRYTPTAPLGDCDSPCYAPTSPSWYYCPNDRVDGCPCAGCAADRA